MSEIINLISYSNYKPKIIKTVHFGPDSEAKIYKSQDMRDKLKGYLDNFQFS